VFRPPVERSRSSLPFHYWLLFLAAGLLFLDVAVRRLAFDPEQVAERARYIWARLRGWPLPPPVQTEAVERLRSRPAAVGSAEDRAGRRYEGGLVHDMPAGVDATAPERPVAQGPRPAAGATPEPAAPEPRPEGQGGNLEDLLKAKKRVWEKDKDKPEGA
jgi:hypothetical protein